MNEPTIVKKGKGVNLLYNGYRYSKDRKKRMQLVSSTGNAHSDPALVEPIQQTQMVSKYSKQQIMTMSQTTSQLYQPRWKTYAGKPPITWLCRWKRSTTSTFHTNQVLFQLGMLIYTQTITEKCQNLLQYVYFCTYEGHLHDLIFFRNKNCL